MSQKYNIEFFQSLGANNVDNGTDLSAAYKKGSVKSLVDSSGSGAISMDSASSGGASGGASAGAANSSYGEDGVGSQSGSNFGNLWQFLGIENLSLKNKHCVYNCGIDTLGCMERCSNPDCRSQDNVTYDQCKYGCLRKGITCSTGCMTDLQQNNSLNNVQVIFTALPNGWAQDISKHLNKNHTLIDLAADFRLAKGYDYIKWYKQKHRATHLIKKSI